MTKGRFVDPPLNADLLLFLHRLLTEPGQDQGFRVSAPMAQQTIAANNP